MAILGISIVALKTVATLLWSESMTRRTGAMVLESRGVTLGSRETTPGAGIKAFDGCLAKLKSGLITLESGATLDIRSVMMV